MLVYACDHHEVHLPPGHRFPMRKYRALREALLDREVIGDAQLRWSHPVPIEILHAAHDPDYVASLVDGSIAPRRMRPIGLPWSPELITRSRASVGGTLAACEAALVDGIAGNLAGGTHHARRDAGSGFCVFNDLAVAARHLLRSGVVRRVLILDLDVHQGDGTAAILGSDPDVFTCSVHGARNFPFHKERSHLDVPLDDGSGDEAFLAAVEAALEGSLRAGPFDLVLYQAGVDALASDSLGRLGVSPEGMRERDRRVLTTLRSAGFPVVLTLGGGYSDPIDATIDAHVATYEEALRVERADRQCTANQAP